MIRPSEIQKIANQNGVRDYQIEKDYILSWILWGIARYDQLKEVLVFKGGTVLKKVYFTDYRFSEDLDFTLLNKKKTKEEIFKWFDEIFSWILDEANIPLTIVKDHSHEDGGFNFNIHYTGPLGGNNVDKKVKVDIAVSEKLAFSTVLKTVIISYSDLQPYSIFCYSLEEIFVEKMRSLIQRTQARDLFDIWHLAEHEGIDFNEYRAEYKIKCEQKGIDGSKLLDVLKKKLPIYKAQWNKVLLDQIQDLPAFDQVEREVLRQLRRIEF